MILAELEQHLDPVLAARLTLWREPSACPPQALLKILYDSHVCKDPWADCLIVYALNHDCGRWTRLIQKVTLLQTIWAETWQAQGSPASMGQFDLTGNWTTPSRQALSISVGYALDRALVDGQAPVSLQMAARVLLPGRYLESLGWLNLDFLPMNMASSSC